MTVWHLSPSLSMHLAHFASPVKVISLVLPESAAKVGVVNASNTRPAMAVRSIDVFLIYCALNGLIQTSMRQSKRICVQPDIVHLTRGGREPDNRALLPDKLLQT